MNERCGCPCRAGAPAPPPAHRMRILFLTSAHNSLSQRAFVELTGLGHAVAVAWPSDAARCTPPSTAIAPT